METLIRWLGVVLCGVGLWGCAQPYGDAQAKLSEAASMLEQGESKAALELLKAAVEAAPESVEARRVYGRVLNERVERYAEAREQFEAAIALRPEDAELYVLLADVYVKQALTAARKEDAALWRSQAVHLLGLAVVRDAYHAEAHEKLARVQLLRGRVSDGMDGFMNSIRADPTRPSAYEGLAFLYFEHGFYKRALEVSENGLANNPRASDLRLVHALSSAALGRFEDAVQHFERAFADQSKGGDEALRRMARFGYGAVLERLGLKNWELDRGQSARENFDAALRVFGSYVSDAGGLVRERTRVALAKMRQRRLREYLAEMDR